MPTAEYVTLPEADWDELTSIIRTAKWDRRFDAFFNKFMDAIPVCLTGTTDEGDSILQTIGQGA